MADRAGWWGGRSGYFNSDGTGRLAGARGTRCAKSWGKNIPGSRNSKYKGPEVGVS